MDNDTAYKLGMNRALKDAGLEKVALNLGSLKSLGTSLLGGARTMGRSFGSGIGDVRKSFDLASKAKAMKGGSGFKDYLKSQSLIDASTLRRQGLQQMNPLKQLSPSLSKGLRRGTVGGLAAYGAGSALGDIKSSLAPSRPSYF